MRRDLENIAVLFEDPLEQGSLSEELAALLRANITDNFVESVMRLRALTEISKHADAETLLGMAAAAERRGTDILDFVAALARPRH